MNSFNFTTVANIQLANGASKSLAEVAASYGMRKPFVVTDKGILEHGLLDDALQAFKQAPTVYADIVADPPEQCVLDAVSTAQGCDGVIGFGGGSSMDVAKLVAVLLKGEQALADCYGVEQIIGTRVPLIQVPTTAGTGSEATAVAIVTTGESTKAGVVSPILFADAIILDPELTLGLPPQVTAATGIDAMVHAIEAYTSKRLKNPISDMLALKALSLMSNSLRTAVMDGKNISARSDMLLGAMYAGQAFANAPVGAVHALAYPLGGVYHIPHGLSNSLVLPHVLRFNASSAEGLYQELAAVILAKGNLSNPAEHLADYFLSLAEELGLPTRLRAMDIPENDIENLAEQAMLQTRLLINNPRDVNLHDAMSIYQAAY